MESWRAPHAARSAVFEAGGGLHASKAVTTASRPRACAERRTPCPAQAQRLRLSGCASARSSASRIATTPAGRSAQTNASRPGEATGPECVSSSRGSACKPTAAYLELRRHSPEQKEELQLIIQWNPVWCAPRNSEACERRTSQASGYAAVRVRTTRVQRRTAPPRTSAARGAPNMQATAGCPLCCRSG